jgi:regulator of protease activity HflC (stomatin/prohibitin superfamily)
MKNEVFKKGQNGFLWLLINLTIIAGVSVALYKTQCNWYILGYGVVLFIFAGFIIVNPNESRVFTLFGKYSGTIKENGFFWVNPLYVKKRISLRARNFDSERLKVNDKLGNPILISVILVWKVEDTYKAAFEVDNYEHFVKVQTDAAVRKLAGMYPYDNFEDGETEVTLRSGLEEVNHAMEQEIADRLSIAGIKVMEARIGYLAYAEEIAQAMLKRQQASAIVSARFKIVEGAVGMVEMALEQLEKKNTVVLDDERKAAMVSNLLVVLCADKEASPVINAGTLHH